MAKSQVYNQATAKPGAKVNAAGAGPIIAGIVTGITAMIWPDIFDRIPPGFELQLGLGLGGVLAWLAAYIKRERV